MSALSRLVEAERRAAVLTHAFEVSAALGYAPDAVPAEQADRGVQYARSAAWGLEESMAAVAGELMKTVAVGDKVDVVPEPPAQVADLPAEDGRVAIEITVCAKEQRVAALHAYVLGMPIALSEFSISVMAEDA
jgi:hypothetical protein